MTEHVDEGFVFDIGVADRSPEPERSFQPKDRRVLPRWASLVIAVLLGWILGALMNGQSTSPAAVEEAATRAATDSRSASDVAAAPPRFEEGPVEAVYEQIGGMVREPESLEDLVTVVMVQAPLRGVAIPADITVIENGIATSVELDRQIAGATQSVIGQGDRRMLVVGEDVVFMALDSVMVLDPVRKTEPVEVARAIYLLPGSEAGRAWAVTSGSRSAVDIDVRRGSARAEYDLTNIGVPLGSFNGGLIVAPANRSLGDFALWSPARGIEKLWSMHDEATFIGAAGNVLVVHTPQGLATYNTVTGSLAQTELDILPSAQHRSIVSPDGSRLAIAQQGSVTELPRVVVVDPSTGEQLDSFDAAFSWQLQWVSNTEVLFMLPNDNSVSVMLRDTTDRTSGLVTDLVGPNFWVTVAS